ncbi:MAG: HAMP domain-containing protein [Methylobacter sp.]|nr:MAG: HAMP domain-containing protein [Methylobacter sp.]
MNNNLLKRRSVFIKKGFQGRFILGILAIILLSGLCSALLIYWITGDELRAWSLSPHANIDKASERLGLSILIGNAVSILVAGAVAVVAVLYASHKIVGPLHRFETLCEQVGNGNLDELNALRANDQLHELARAFDDMVAKLRSRRDQQAGLLVGINNHIRDLKSSDNLTTEQLNILSELAEAVAQLNKPDDKEGNY